MQAITKTDIARARKAIKIADKTNDYSEVEWAFGEIEAIIDKAEAILKKLAETQPCNICKGTRTQQIQDDEGSELVPCGCVDQ
jgi:hypothetical protein